MRGGSVPGHEAQQEILRAVLNHRSMRGSGCVPANSARLRPVGRRCPALGRYAAARGASRRTCSGWCGGEGRDHRRIPRDIRRFHEARRDAPRAGYSYGKQDMTNAELEQKALCLQSVGRQQQRIETPHLAVTYTAPVESTFAQI